MALRTVEPERRAQTASETSRGRRRYARWGVPLTHSNLSPPAMASARSQRVSLAETAQGIRVEQYSHRGRAHHHSETRRKWRCHWRSKSVTSCHTLSHPFCARAIANCVAFPCGDARAPGDRVVLPACLEVENPVGAAVSARATSTFAPRSRTTKKRMSSL
jgi:hypothetical protein